MLFLAQFPLSTLAFDSRGNKTGGGSVVAVAKG